MNEQHFNLLDEPWIPVAGNRRVSLLAIFTDSSLTSLGGNARQKIAILKLLQAIAQAACTPPDDTAWRTLGTKGMADACAAYLEKWRDSFYLYGPQPFLQMPVAKAAAVPFGTIMPEIATGNTPRFAHVQCEREVGDADRALILITEMSLALGGKKGDHRVTLAPGHAKKPTAAAGPAVGYLGLLHSFLTGSSIMETVWLNLLSAQTIAGLGRFTAGTGRPPWEQMPASEICPVAQELMNSLMGRLVPLARFCLIGDNGIHITEGISHPDYKADMLDPSAAANRDKKDVKMLWADPDKRPWRSLSAMLSFLGSTRDSGKAGKGGFQCEQLEFGAQRLAAAGVESFGIWSGGLRVSGNAGEQYVSGTGDQVESEIELYTADLDNANWYPELSLQMKWLEDLSTMLFACVNGYYKEQGVEDNRFAQQACGVFWELAERLFPRLLRACAEPELVPELKKDVRKLLFDVYDESCPQGNARQFCAWAKHRPQMNKAAKPASGKGKPDSGTAHNLSLFSTQDAGDM